MHKALGSISSIETDTDRQRQRNRKGGWNRVRKKASFKTPIIPAGGRERRITNSRPAWT
jgi:hypothetical protein